MVFSFNAYQNKKNQTIAPLSSNDSMNNMFSEKKTDLIGMGEESINEDDLSIFKRQLCYLLELVLDDLAAWYFGRRGRG